MASQPPRRVLEPLAAPQHYVPPGARELRAQAVQRLQTGLFGLAAVILIVGLANIINDRAIEAEAANRPPGPAALTEPKRQNADPLVDIGVLPSSVPEKVQAVRPPPTAQPAPAPRPSGQPN